LVKVEGEACQISLFRHFDFGEGCERPPVTNAAPYGAEAPKLSDADLLPRFADRHHHRFVNPSATMPTQISLRMIWAPALISLCVTILRLTGEFR
jgi:hypothetical protein